MATGPLQHAFIEHAVVSGATAESTKRVATAIDLCAGAGGMSLGLEMAGFEVIAANELNKDASKTYRLNFPHVVLLEQDIRKLDPSKFK